MKMPISEIIDRYTITLLKSERTTEDVGEELSCYKAEIATYEEERDVSLYVQKMYEINGKIWDTEGEIRKGTELPLETVGRLALKVRDLNRARNGIKAEIVNEFCEGFKELKINYTKVDYGRTNN
jgi:hypothetical protein